jgi:carbon-monoxide dehydrogenase medium subunit
MYVGHPQIRTRGTLGGSLAHADPAAELPAAAVALDATMVVASVRGERRIPVGEFFKFHFTTALAEDELLTAVEFPVTVPHEGSAFLEVAARFGDFAAVGAAAVVQLDGDGRVTRARIVCLSVGLTPARMADAEELLLGRSLDGRLLEEVETVVVRSLQPTSDLKASAAYKRRTAGVLARRVVEQAGTVAQRRVA